MEWHKTFELVMEECNTKYDNLNVTRDFSLDEFKIFFIQDIMNGMYQLITKPTQETKDTITLNDHIYVSDMQVYDDISNAKLFNTLSAFTIQRKLLLLSCYYNQFCFVF